MSMRAARRQGMLRVVRCGTRPSARVRVRTPLVQHLLRGGGYKRGLHAFQGGRKHRGRFSRSKEDKGGREMELPESQSWRRLFGA